MGIILKIQVTGSIILKITITKMALLRFSLRMIFGETTRKVKTGWKNKIKENRMNIFFNLDKYRKSLQKTEKTIKLSTSNQVNMIQFLNN